MSIDPRQREQELSRAREAFWDDVREGLADRSVRRPDADESVRRFREQLTARSLEDLALHDGPRAVVEHILRRMGW